MERRKGSVAERLKRTTAKRRQGHEVHTEVRGPRAAERLAIRTLGFGAAAIHTDGVSAGDESLADLLDCGLEPAVPRGHPACSHHRDAERFCPRARCVRHPYIPPGIITVTWAAGEWCLAPQCGGSSV